MEQDRLEAVAARGCQAAMVEELRKVELVRDRLENLHLDRAVEENIGALQGALLHPRGT